MPRKCSVTESIFIARSPEVVWDYTQDYGRRREWDRSILEAKVLSLDPVPRVRIRARGGLTAIFQYKLFERAQRTSLAMVEVSSWLIEGGGGAWSYEAREGGTLWTQVNTLAIKDGWWRTVFVGIAQRQLRNTTRRALRRAKAILEE